MWAVSFGCDEPCGATHPHGMIPHMPSDRSHQRSRGSLPLPFDRSAYVATTHLPTLREAFDARDWTGDRVRELALAVGGIDALELLDAEPLPDEPFG